MSQHYEIRAFYDVDRDGQVRSRIELAGKLPTQGSLDPAATIDRVIAERVSGGPTSILVPKVALSPRDRETMLDHVAELFTFAPRLFSDTLTIAEVPHKDGLRLSLRQAYRTTRQGPKIGIGSRGDLTLLEQLPGRTKGFTAFADAVFIAKGVNGPLIITRGPSATSPEARAVGAILTEQVERYRRELGAILLHDPRSQGAPRP